MFRFLCTGLFLMWFMPACRLLHPATRAGHYTNTATAISGAELIGGVEIDTGRYLLFHYERYFDIPNHSDVWSDNSVFIKIKALDDLPAGQLVAIPGTAATVSGYLKGTWYFESRQKITGTITRLASTATGHRLKISLKYADPKGKLAVLVEDILWFRNDSTYFQDRKVDYKGKYDDLRLALKEPAKVKSLDLVTYAIQYDKRNGKDTGLDTLYQRLGELYNLKELNLHLNHLESLPESMRKLKRLKRLDLGYNRLTTFPEVVFALDSLQELNLEWNRLDSIPPRVAQLRQLNKLNLGDNNLNHYPMAVNAITSLRVLGLDNTNLRFLPTQIQQLVNLEKLSLDGFWNVKRRNQLEDITALYYLGKLRSLSLKDNGTIKGLEHQLYELHRLRKLQELNLEWNSGVDQLDTTRLPKLNDWNIEKE
ncbi:leucine-rich repeat domain-containing protein [Hymenobacter sp. B1770]|uniref:leucine-rich repeat domain-containing protein n=1 Tax=Hymenobacter sp. B1770 TaxID=1718788 RepID=UPI003CFB7D20